MGCGASAGKEGVAAPVTDAPKAAPAPKAQPTQEPKAAAGYPSEAAAKAPVASLAEAKPALEPVTKTVAPEAPPEPPPKPCLHYYQFAGRGELTRLIAAVGGLDIDDHMEHKEHIHYGSPGCFPLLEHGQLRISQSFAIEAYIASIAPAFKDLTPTQRATDAMFCKIKEDLIAGTRSNVALIIEDESQKAAGAELVTNLLNKWLPVLEGMLPATGFINGLASPTSADLAVLNLARGFMPFGAAYMLSGIDVASQFPKFAAHAEKVAANPAVKAYLDRSKTMDADPMDLRAKLGAAKPAAAPEVKEEAGPAAPQAKEGTTEAPEAKGD